MSVPEGTVPHVTVTTPPAIDWTSIGSAFAAAYNEFEANDYLHVETEAPEPSGFEVVDADEPADADDLRATWLKPVADIRHFFRHEAADFTPWVAENLAK